MTAHSQAALRAQAAPDRCRRCYHVEAFAITVQPRRYSCRKNQLMHDGCGYFVGLPFGREAVPEQTKS